MRNWFQRLRQPVRRPRPGRPMSFRPILESLEERSLLDAGITGFTMTNLASDLKGVAAHTDASLINPWGFAETPTGRFQVAANGSGDMIRFDARGATLGKPVVLQPPLGSPPGTTTTPNGAFLNTTSDFVISDDGNSAPAEIIFSTEDGTLVAFNGKVDPKEGILVAQSSDGAVFKLLAEASTSQGNFLYATDFHNNKIAVFDKNFAPVTLGQNGFGTFTDPNEPAGYAPFGVKAVNLGGQTVLFVTYAKQDVPGAGHDDVAGLGNGLIDEFTTTGQFIQRFATGSAVGGTAPLNSPIGATIAPAGFGPNGKFGGALLVGNFGDSHVSAFNLQTGQFLGQLSDAQGNPLTLNGGVGSPGSKGLWGIAFGNGQGGTDPNALYFAAGINAENDGLFGKVTLSTAGKGNHSDIMMSGTMMPTMTMPNMMMSSPSAGNMQQSNPTSLAAMPPSVFAQLENQLEARLTALFGQSMNGSGMMSLMQTLDQLVSEELSMIMSFEMQLVDQLLNHTGM